MSIIDWLFGKKKEGKPVVMKTALEEQAKKAEPLTAKPAPVIEEQYVNDCLRQKYKELPETRSWNSDPAFRKVLDPLNSGHNDVACREAEALVAQFGDFSNLYAWWGAALLRMGSLDKARQVLKDGLESGKEKYPLCNRLGEVEWEARDLKTAVYWWAQGMQCQESLNTSNYGDSEGAYLYLHYVAEGLSLSECSKAFLMRVDSIRPGMIRLSAETANDLISLARSAKNRSIEQVLKELVQRYIIPKKTSTAKVDPNELRLLIRQLDEVASQSRWADGEKDVKAIERLTELGDPQAIDVLTRVARGGMLIDVIDAAEKAIEKIKMANR